MTQPISKLIHFPLIHVLIIIINSNFQSLKKLVNSIKYFDSIMLSYDKQSDLLKLCNFEEKDLKLLYRATRDGFSAESFHSKCDNIPNTTKYNLLTKTLLTAYLTHSVFYLQYILSTTVN